MAVATFEAAQPLAGPSSPIKSVKTSPTARKRTAEFTESSEDEDLISIGTTVSPRKVNGHMKKRKLVKGKDTDNERKARKAEAERLFVTRQELPFYQGRKMILEEIMAHDTTIVRTPYILRIQS